MKARARELAVRVALSAFGYRKLKLEPNISNTVFDIFVKSSRGKQRILKIPKSKGRSYRADKFRAEIGNLNEARRYRETLLSLETLPFLKKHVSRPRAVFPGGGYSSDYIQGMNLQTVKDQGSQGSPKLAEAIEDLLMALDNYKSNFGYFPGDWGHQNLVYDEAQGRIVNVDLEGFYSRDTDNHHSHQMVDGLEQLKQDLVFCG